MHGPAVYLILVLLFALAGLLLFAAGSSWIRVARNKDRRDEPGMVPPNEFRAVAGLTAAALVLLGAALLWTAAVAVLLHV